MLEILQFQLTLTRLVILELLTEPMEKVLLQLHLSMMDLQTFHQEILAMF